jgi:teichoic acid transport system ATP-binding protein
VSSLSASELHNAGIHNAGIQTAGRAAASATDPDYQHAISVRDVYINYRSVIDPRTNTLRHSLARMGRSTRTARVIEAVKGMSFDVEHGTVLGIIGANGAGKSTIMKAIAGILPPTTGEIVVNGRISTLLALGVGFNGHLSGRENVILGSLAAGLTRRQVNERFEEIAAWAELGEFIDMPMKAYSSGMYGRLAFAVSTHLDPDVLLVDEALSTGDAHFRRKSYEKMQELVGQARTIVIVSHGIGAIKEMCDDCIWIDKGKIVRRGSPAEIAAEYLEFQGVPQSEKIDEAAEGSDDLADDFAMDEV